MFRLAVVLTLLLHCALPGLLMAETVPPSQLLEKVREYHKEKSWQLAVKAVDDSDTASLSQEVRRELLYLKALSLKELTPYGSNHDVYLEQLLQENADDIWAGMAHWKLQKGLSNGSWLNIDTSSPLKHLRAAEHILVDLKYNLLPFYREVVDSNLVFQHFPEKDDSEYILSYFDKLTPLLADNEEQLAEVARRKQQVLNSVQERKPEEQLAGWRAIVAEFPNTRAAAQCQWEVCRHYIDRKDYIAALYELNLLTNRFAGTDEARSAFEEIERIKRPEATFNLSSQFYPGDKIEFPLWARNTGSVRLSVIPYDLVGDLKKQEFTQPDLTKVTGKAVRTQSVSVETNDKHLPTSTTVLLDYSKPGMYVLRAEVNGKPTSNRLLLISNLALAGNLNSGRANYELWTVDARSGKPRPSTSITMAYNVDSKNRWLSGEQIQFFSSFKNITTNQDGFADFSDSKSNHGAMAIAASGDNIAFLENVYWSPFSRSDTPQPISYIYTDRPVYRPEQQVYWRAVVRNKVDGQYEMPGSETYSVIVRDSKNQEISRKTDVKLSEYGTLADELTLPVGAPLGSYNINVQRTSDNRNVGTHGFQVEEYKKPEFEVSVEAASDFARVGDEVKARVQANYLFGAPVADATVKYTVRRRPRFQILWDQLTWHLDDRDLGWFENPQERPPTLHGSDGVIVAEGESKLNPDGSFDLTFDSTVPDDELKENPSPRPFGRYGGFIWPPAPRAWDFQVEVTVTDASRRNIDASQVIPVGLKALKLAAKTQRNIVTPGDNARVEIKSMNLADKPVATNGTLYVEKLVWNETTEADDITTVSEQATSIESSGSLVLNWRVPAELRGRLRFAYITDDPFGGKSVAYADFFSASPDDTDVAARYQGIEIIADKTNYTVGETARLMILNEYKDTYIWYWEDVGSGSLRRQVMALPHRTNFVNIPITDAYVPNSMVHLVAVRDQKFISDEVELIVPPTQRVINVEVTPGATQVEPGTTGEVTLRATDDQGKPVSAELSLSIFDQAITYIMPDSRQDIRKVLYGMRRPLRSDVRHSLQSNLHYGGPINNDTYQYMSHIEADYFGQSKNGRTGGLDRMMLAGQAAPPPAFAAAPSMHEMAATRSVSANAEAKMALSFADEPVAEFKKESSPEMKMPAIRTDFRDSMFWSPAVVTDANGQATVQIKYPDSLTTWRMVAVGLTPDTRVGNTTTQTIARKKIMARLQTPRFFRERDELVISANLHNYTDSAISMDATLRARGVTIEAAQAMPLNGDASFSGNTRKVTVPAGGETRVDWNVKVESAALGEAVLNLAALSSAGSDAMQTTIPLLAHGIDKFVAWNGTSEDQSSTGVIVQNEGDRRIISQVVTLPNERIKETSRLDISVQPSLAASIRDAIPYMIDYPYGCVEQTMSRFMPAAVASRAFQVLGYPLDKNLQDKLPKVTEEGLKRLRDMQLPQGGWGWWANDSENMQMTAYVMQGLTLARDAEVTVDPAVFDRGLNRLAQLRDDYTSTTSARKSTGWWYSGNLHNLMFAEYVLTLNGKPSQKTRELLWDRRDELTARGLAMLARTMAKLGRQSDAELVLRNMYNKAVPTPENNTLRWGKLDSSWWYDDAVEATAIGLMAYLEISPDDPAVEQAMKWLVLNRQGNRWKSTRDTAHGVLALTQYMLVKKEAAKPVSIEVYVNDKLVKTLNVTPENFWNFDGKITLHGNEIPNGSFPVKFVISGEGKAYYSIFAEYFTLEEHIQKAGNEIYVTRTYEKLHREQTTETVNGKTSAIHKDSWLPLKDGDSLNSGDEVRVTLHIKSLNDYEYILFEDPKPAGMEPVDLVSGSRYGDGLCSNMELRDKWIAFFITTLRQGEHTLSYNMRAEIPGTFHTMPTTGQAMYFPPLRTNSDEIIMTITD